MDDEDYDFLLDLADQMEADEDNQAPTEEAILKKVAAYEQQARQQGAPNARSLQGVVQFGQAANSQKQTVPTGYIEELSGLRVSRPKISSIVLQESFSGFCRVQLSKVSSRATSQVEGPWVTVAVLTQKTSSLSSSGKMYLRWQISDLDETSICVFLFGQAHRDLNKEVEGSVVALYNTEMRTEGGKVSLTVKDASQVTVVGSTSDFTLCKGTKKNGERCTMAVNRSKCEYCIYHAPAALKQLSKVTRKDVNVADTSLGMKLQRQVTYSTTNAVIARANQSVYRARVYSCNEMQQIAQAALKDSGNSKGARLLMSLAQSQPGGSAHKQPQQSTQQNKSSGAQGRSSGTHGSKSSGAQPQSAGVQAEGVSGRPGQGTSQSQSASRKRCREEFVELDDEDDYELGSSSAASVQAWNQSEARLRAIQLLREKGGLKASDPNNTRACSSKSKLTKPDENATPTLAGTAGLIEVSPPANSRKSSSQPSAASQQDATTTSQLPTASRQLPSGSVLGSANLNTTRPGLASHNASTPMGLASNRPAPNRTGTQATDKTGVMRQSLGIKNRVAAAPAPSSKPGQTAPLGNSKPNHSRAGKENIPPTSASAAVSSFAAAFGGVAAAVGKEQTLESRYEQQVGDKEDEQIFKFVSAMEQKDQLAQKLDATTKVQTSAWQCEVCKRCSEYFPKECRAEGHSIKKVQATKRWWTCNACSNHFSCIGAVYPTKRCPRCQDPAKEFKPATAFRAPKHSQFGGESSRLACKDHMLARGQEHGKFLLR